MVKNWSIDRIKNKTFAFLDSIKVEDETWILTYHYLFTEPVGIILKFGETDVFRLSRDRALIKKDLMKIANFDDFVKCMLNVHEVKLVRGKWEESTCSCFNFNKHYNCFHVMAVAVTEKLLVIPHKFRACPINQKKKTGRPKKAKIGESLLKQ